MEKSTARATCIEDGCLKPARTKRKCGAHYMRERYRSRVADPNVPRCAKPGCSAPGQIGSGMCNNHSPAAQKRMRSRTTRETAPKRHPVDARDELGRKYCSRCDQWVLEGDFSINRRLRDGLDLFCKPCKRFESLWNLYRLRPKDYHALLTAQGGTCAICPALPPDDGRLVVDHDHACCPGGKSCGKCVRALLCSACNKGLGLFRDDAERMERAAAYVRRHRKES